MRFHVPLAPPGIGKAQGRSQKSEARSQNEEYLLSALHFLPSALCLPPVLAIPPRDSEGALSTTSGALLQHTVILSGAKNLALGFPAEKRQGEMLRGVYPERSERAQHDTAEGPGGQ
jgi:hypothetical protein